MNARTPLAMLCFAGAFAAACGGAPPPPATPQPPARVVAAVNAALAEYDGPGVPRARWPTGAARAVAVSPDGTADWLVDFEAFGFPAWCGTGGCRQQLWVSRDGDYVLAFDAQALEFAVRAAERPVIEVELHGVYCNGTGTDACPRAFAWHAATGRLDEIPTRGGATRLSGPLFQPIPIDPAALPRRVAAARDWLRQACVARGGRYEEYDMPIASVPDLDGDAQRDWIVDASLTACEAGAAGAGAAPIRVFLSGAGNVHEAAPVPGGEYDIDVGSNPARLLPRSTDDEVPPTEASR